MKGINILLFIIIFPSFCYSQETIEQYLSNLKSCKSLNDSLKIYEKIGKIAINSRNPNEGIKYSETFLNLAKRKGDLENVTIASMYISEFYSKLNNYNYSISHAKEALSYARKLKDLNTELKAYNQLARSYQKFDKYEDAIATYLEAIDLGKDSKLSVQALLYSNLSSAYKKLGDKDKQISCLKTAMELSDKYGTPQQKSYSKYVLAYDLMDNGRYEEAEKYFLDSIKDSLNFNNSTYIFANHHGLGLNYSRWGKLEKAKIHNNIALKHCKEVGDKIYESDVLNNLAGLYYRLKEADSTILFANKALTLAKELKHEQLIAGSSINLLQGQILKNSKSSEISKTLNILDKYINSLNGRYEEMASYWLAKGMLEEQKGQYKNALKYQKNYSAYLDSTSKEKMENKIEELNIEYETEKKQSQILLLKDEKLLKDLEVSQQKNIARIFILGFLIISGLLGFTYFLYKKTKKQNSHIKFLQNESHHRIKNNLSIISSFIDDVKNKSKGTVIQESLKELQNRISSINEVHKLLLKSPSINGQIDLKNYVENLINNIKSTLGKFNKELVINVASELKLRQAEVFPLGIIINEFITNSYKHNNDTEGSLLISIKQSGKKIDLILEDENVNIQLSGNIENSKSYGVRLIEVLAKQLGSKAIWQTDKNVILKVNFAINDV